MTEKEVLYTLDTFKKKGFIRNIAALFHAAGLGYKSTLCALKGAPEIVDRLARGISKHPGVSHNYLRDHDFNLWFTITIKKGEDFREEIIKLTGGLPFQDLIVLPSLKTYKLRVAFSFTSRGVQDHKKKKTVAPVEREWKDEEKKLILMLQQDLPMVPAPWDYFAERLKISEKKLITKIEKLKTEGVIRRISAILKHRKVGYSANGMTCFVIAPDKIDEAGTITAGFKEVSHCYHRPVYPGWPYSLFAMVHAGSKEECNSLAGNIASRIGCEDYSILYSTKEYKKERVKYFHELSS